MSETAAQWRITPHLHVDGEGNRWWLRWPDGTAYGGPFKTAAAAKRELTLMRQDERFYAGQQWPETFRKRVLQNAANTDNTPSQAADESRQK